MILTRVKQLIKNYTKILPKKGLVFFLTFGLRLFYGYEKVVLKEREVKSSICCHRRKYQICEIKIYTLQRNRFPRRK